MNAESALILHVDSSSSTPFEVPQLETNNSNLADTLGIPLSSEVMAVMPYLGPTTVAGTGLSNYQDALQEQIDRLNNATGGSWSIVFVADHHCWRDGWRPCEEGYVFLLKKNNQSIERVVDVGSETGAAHVVLAIGIQSV